VTARPTAQPKNPPSRQPLTVAITGGIGAGKSEALRAFARHGAATGSSDAVVHRLIAEDPDVRSALLERFGTTDRGEIAAVVFEDRDALAWLEGLLHPRVQAESARWLEEVAARPDPPALVAVEIPLLYETGGEVRFDAVVVVTAPEEVRAARTRVRPDARGNRLLPDEEKIRRATYAYVNDGTVEELDAFVADVVRALTAGAPA
jgi:dephospho-CoA kinase